MSFLESFKRRVLRKRHAYRLCFFDANGNLSVAGNIVMADLRRFCRATVSTTVVSQASQQVDVPASFQAEGRREVFMRFCHMLHVSDEDIHRMVDEDLSQGTD